MYLSQGNTEIEKTTDVKGTATWLVACDPGTAFLP